jgi:arginase family enzyme
MNLNNYFNPVELDKPENTEILSDSVLGRNIRINTVSTPIDEISNYKIAILGIPEDRNSSNKGVSLAPDNIRTKLYQLYKINDKLKIIDLGNLKEGNTYNDTYYGLRDVLIELLNNQVISVIMGGTQDLTYAGYLAFEHYKNNVNLITVDSVIDLDENRFDAKSFLSRIILNNEKIFKYVNLAHQQYLNDQRVLKKLESLFFDSLRLGLIRSDISMVEPILRDADILSFDICAIKQSDAPANYYASPNGLHADEACQIAKYSGLSDSVSSFGIYELNPVYENNNQTASLAAQIIWYFIEGYSVRKIENPLSDNKNFKIFIVSHKDMEYELTFYKSMITNRWWMSVPKADSSNPLIIACSHDDYEQACKHEIPDLWWKSYQRIN